MTKPTPIQGSDGKFKGSIGTGKTDVPVPQLGATFDMALLRNTINGIKTSNPTISMEDLYTIYMEEKTAKETREAEAEAAAKQKADEEAAQEAYWAAFTPAVGDSLPAKYDTHRHLAVGTVVRSENTAGGYWDGSLYVKTGDATWGRLSHGRGTLQEIEQQASKAVNEQWNNISPCPAGNGGDWVIISLLPGTPAGETDAVINATAALGIDPTKESVPTGDFTLLTDPQQASIGDRVYGNDAATRALPRGTLIRVENASEEGWDGTHYLKTASNRWTAVEGDTAEKISNNSYDLIYGIDAYGEDSYAAGIGYPADPQRAHGTWVIVDIITPAHM